MSTGPEAPKALGRRAALGTLAGLATGGLVACAGPVPPLSGPHSGLRPGPPARPGLVRIAVASCCNQNQPQPLWDAVMAEQPEHLVFAGDNVYASQQPFRIEALRAAYAQQAQVPGFARLRQRIAHSAIWDDHDYGLNDGGAGFAHQQASKDAFIDFWGLPADDERRSRPGLHHARVIAQGGRRVQIIVLDTRWWRSDLKPTDVRGAPGRERYLPDADPGKTLLGPEQWRWLGQRLREPADARLVVSSIQVLAEGHGYERWGNLPLERARLLAELRDSGARNVVLASGDRHIGALYQHLGDGGPREAGAALLEITSSGVTHPWTTASEPGPNRIGALVREPHFGVVSFDFDAQAITLGLRGLFNQSLHAHRVPMQALEAA